MFYFNRVINLRFWPLAAILLTSGLAACQSAKIERTLTPSPPKTHSKTPTSITNLLPPNDQAPQKITVASQWSLIAVGDILLAGSATPELKKTGYASPFSNYVDIIHDADVAYGNFEAPVGTKGQPDPEKKFTFQMPPSVLPVLKDIGFDVFHLANNHILDFGEEALFETLNLLDQFGFKHCGAGSNSKTARTPATTMAQGLIFAFVCYSNTFPEEFWAKSSKPGTAFGHLQWLKEDINIAKQHSDIVIAGFHWGSELMRQPKDYQRTLAHAAIDAGASAVIGHHPHVLQPIEMYHGRPIAYSLGNFVFGSYSNKVKTSVLLKLEGSGNQIADISVLPINVHNPTVIFHPADLPERQAREVAEFLFKTSVTNKDRWWQTNKCFTSEICN